MLTRTLAVWLVLMVLAILNGVSREALLAPRLGELDGHVVSTLVLSVVILAVTWVATPWIGVRSVGDAWRLGARWLVLTLAFEFLAGHYVFGHSWARLLADYDVSQGRIWPLVLLVTLVAPAVVLRARGARSATS